MRAGSVLSSAGFTNRAALGHDSWLVFLGVRQRIVQRLFRAVRLLEQARINRVLARLDDDDALSVL